MQKQMLESWVKEISEVTSVWLKLNIKDNFFEIESSYRNNYLMKISQIVTIRKIDQAFLIKTEGGFLFIDTVSNKVSCGI